jgi:PTH2 family peptidyl-tRNA hydrolase
MSGIDKNMSDEKNKDKDDTEIRLYCIMRDDIDIPIGKMLAQAGHAFVSVLEAANETNRAVVVDYFANAQPKIALRGNLNAVKRAAGECRQAGIPHYVVTDAGRTVFPEATVTCIGIGPVDRASLPKFVARLRLF